MRAPTTTALLAPAHQLMVCADFAFDTGVTYLLCDPTLDGLNDIGCAEDPHVAAQFAASGPMRQALETTRGNLLSLMARTQYPADYREWLAVVEEALAAACDTESIR